MDRAASSYLNGVTVKVSEKYRPPRKPTLPAGLCNIEPPSHLFTDNFEYVDELSALNLIEAIRKRRSNEQCVRKQRIAEFESKVTEEKDEQSETKDVEDSTSDSNKLELSNLIVATPVIPPSQNGHLQLLSHGQMPVLTPTLSSSVGETRKEKLSAINLAEFENFSTNPFEEMELKTLNDKAELALLLQPTQVQPTQPHHTPLGMSYNTFNSAGMQWTPTQNTGTQAAFQQPHPNMQYSNPSTIWTRTENVQPMYQQSLENKIGRIVLNNESGPSQVNSSAPPSQGTLRQAKSVPDLSDLGGFSQHNPTPSPEFSMVSYPDKRLSSRTPPPRLSTAAISKPIPRSILNLESAVERNLNSNEKHLVRQLSDMGFPRDLCARVVTRIGANEKDVLDQLLIIQKFEDKGYDRHRIESILELLKPNKEILKVLEEHFQLSEQLSGLGFNNEKIDSALVAACYDRDKAIDLLCE